MSGRRTGLGWAGVAALVALGIWPMAPSTAAADSESVQVENVAEAWYVSPVSTPIAEGAPVLPPPPPLPDVCTLPIGCPAGPLPVPTAPPSPATAAAAVAYPAGTLHVQATGGQRTAHSYVVPNTTAVPLDATIVSGTMLLPLNKQDDSGNVSAETARIVACLTTEPVTDGVEGGTEDAPDFGCQRASSKVKFDEKEHAFVVDLSPFLEEWASGRATNYGIALVPALDLGPDANWQVTLNGDSVERGKKASSTLVYQLPEPIEPAPQDEPEDTESPEATPSPSPDAGSGSGPAVNPLTPEVAPPPAEVAPAAAAPPLEAEPAPLAAAPFALLNSPWYTYRGVVFLPLAFLIAMGLTGRSLTRPLARVPRR